jgi:hypothetical protein
MNKPTKKQDRLVSRGSEAIARLPLWFNWGSSRALPLARRSQHRRGGLPVNKVLRVMPIVMVVPIMRVVVVPAEAVAGRNRQPTPLRH